MVVWRIRDGRALARLGLQPATHVEMRGVIPASFSCSSGVSPSFRCVCVCFPSWPQSGDFLVAVLAPEEGNVAASPDCRQEHKVALYDWQGLDNKLSLPNGIVGHEGAGINSIVACCASPIDHLDGDIVTRYVNTECVDF